MTPNEETRLAHAMNDLRPDWPISSLATFIRRHLGSRTYRDAAVMLTWIACDMDHDGQPASQTPKRVLEQGPWKLAAAVGGTTALRPAPPRRDQECRTHAGQWADSCAGCRIDARIDDPEARVPLPRPASHADASLARSLLAATRQSLCADGVRVEVCPIHRPDTKENPT